MRVLVQRVASAEVRVGGRVVGAIGRGLLALVGVGAGDAPADAELVARRLLALRLFEGADGRAWSASVSTLGLSILLVSQFTLHASTRKTKPSFQRAAGGDLARPLFEEVVRLCRAEPALAAVETGAFGEQMEVALVNSGPVTVWLDSKNPHDLPWGGGGEAEGEGGGGRAGDEVDADC
jgi:D-tyrosyl-tRNA(Tyr) deacylase